MPETVSAVTAEILRIKEENPDLPLRVLVHLHDRFRTKTDLRVAKANPDQWRAIVSEGEAIALWSEEEEAQKARDPKAKAARKRFAPEYQSVGFFHGLPKQDKPEYALKFLFDFLERYSGPDTPELLLDYVSRYLKNVASSEPTENSGESFEQPAPYDAEVKAEPILESCTPWNSSSAADSDSLTCFEAPGSDGKGEQFSLGGSQVKSPEAYAQLEIENVGSHTPTRNAADNTDKQGHKRTWTQFSERATPASPLQLSSTTRHGDSLSEKARNVISFLARATGARHVIG